MNEHAFDFLDLFAGVGGFHYALKAESGRCVLAVERDSDCQRVYGHTFPGCDIESDIRNITIGEDGYERELDVIAEDVPDHDVLCAGFPCQPFSKSGQQEGVRDRTRGTLFYDVMTIVLAKRPRFVMLENVRNLAGPRHTGTWSDIIKSLHDAQYEVSSSPLVLSPHRLAREEGGTPQIRDRVFILAHRQDGPFDPDPSPLLDRHLSPGWDPDDWRIEDWLDDDSLIHNLSDYRLTDEESAWVEAWQEFVNRIESDALPGFPIWVDAFKVKPRIPSDTPPWKREFLKKNAAFYRKHRSVVDTWRKERWSNGQTVGEFPTSRRKFEWQARKAQPTRSERDLSKLVLQFRPSGIRVKPTTYLPALVAITQTSIIGSRMRRITPCEAARLQGMPEDMYDGVDISDAAAYKQLGNAVNVGVARAAAQALFAKGKASWLAERPDPMSAAS